MHFSKRDDTFFIKQIPQNEGDTRLLYIHHVF